MIFSSKYGKKGKIKIFLKIFEKGIAICKKMWYNNKAVKQMAHWSSGQDASLSRWKLGFDSRMGHQKRNIRTKFGCFFLSKPQAWYGITPWRAWNRHRRMASPKVHLSAAWFHTALRADSIRDCVAIPYRNKLRISSTATPWFGCERRTIWQRIYCLNTRSNWLARLQSSAMNIRLILIRYIKSKNPHQVFLPTFPKHNTLKAFLICFLNLRFHWKNAVKQKVD